MPTLVSPARWFQVRAGRHVPAVSDGMRSHLEIAHAVHLEGCGELNGVALSTHALACPVRLGQANDPGGRNIALFAKGVLGGVNLANESDIPQRQLVKNYIRIRLCKEDVVGSQNHKSGLPLDVSGDRLPLDDARSNPTR